MRMTLLLTVLVMGFVCPEMINAADCTWQGPFNITNAEWNDTNNWSCGSVPGGSDNAIFDMSASFTESLTTNAKFEINAGAVLSINNAVTLTLNGTRTHFTINDGQVVNNGSLSGHNMDVNASGSFTNNGTVSAWNNINVIGGTLTNNGSTFSINNLAVNAGGVANNNGTYSGNQINVGNNNATSGTFNNAGTMTLTDQIIVEEGTFNNNSGSITTPNKVIIENGGNFVNDAVLNSDQINISSTGSFTNNETGCINIANTVANGEWAIQVGGTFVNSGKIVIDDVISAGGINVQSNASFTNNATGNISITVDVSDCAVRVRSNATFTNNGTVNIIQGDVCCVGTCDGSMALPLELIAFSIEVEKDVNVIKWQTAYESNVASHIVERSGDGLRTWIEIGRTDGAKESDVLRTYFLEDHFPIHKAYYRLRSVDYDQTESISPVVYVERTSDKFGLVNVYPVPAKNKLHIEVASESNGQTKFDIYDLFGRRMEVQRIDGLNSNTAITLGIQGLAKGTYLLVFDDSTARYSQLFMKN